MVISATTLACCAGVRSIRMYTSDSSSSLFTLDSSNTGAETRSTHCHTVAVLGSSVTSVNGAAPAQSPCTPARFLKSSRRCACCVALLLAPVQPHACSP
jgi:hypothetical protein